MIKFFRKIRKKLLTENNFSKYLLYAIGEIFLVVIGIFIAIQFNDWNEEKKNKKITSNNIELLIASLEKDSIAFNKMQVYVENDQAKLRNYSSRLNQPTANLDTLKKITRYEFRSGIGTIKFDNDNTYDALLQSGEINLLNRKLKKELFTLYSLHKTAKESDDIHFETYLDWLMKLRSKYPNDRATFKEGPISDLIWKKATTIELANAFSAVINSKTNHYRLVSRYLNELIGKTNNVLEKLKEARKVNY